MTGKDFGEQLIRLGNNLIKYAQNEKLDKETEDALSQILLLNMAFAGVESEEAKSREVK